MPLDANFPCKQAPPLLSRLPRQLANVPSAFLYTHVKPKEEPHIVTLSYTVSGSEPQAIYTLTRSPTLRNTYSLTLSDASFPSIHYAHLTTALEFAATTPPDPPKPLLPKSFTLNLLNPTSTVTISLLHTTLRGNFWEFTLPKQSFTPPSASRIDTHYTAPPSTHLTFRWRKEGSALTRRQLRCSLVSPGNLPGAKRNAGAAEPDIPLAMYSGLASTRGELTIYESNLARVELEDMKGLEMVLLISARVINDIHFVPTAQSFNTALPAPDRYPTPAPAAPIPVDHERERRLAREQEAIRAMLTREAEEAEAGRRKVEAETERLRGVYAHNRVNSVPAARPQQSPAPPKPTPRAHSTPGARVMPRPQQRPPVVGGSGAYSSPGGYLTPDTGKRLEAGSRRKSFLGLSWGGGGGEGKLKKKQSGVW